MRPAGATDPKYAGYNDFILHNSFRPNAEAFQAGSRPSFANGNVLLVTEEDYEQTDCTQAGSFQTWWVKRLDGTPDAIVPLDKVELSDLGNFPLPAGRVLLGALVRLPTRSGIVAAGFYGGGTQFLDVRNPQHIKSYGYATGAPRRSGTRCGCRSTTHGSTRPGARATSSTRSTWSAASTSTSSTCPATASAPTPTPGVVRRSDSPATALSVGVLPVGLVGAAPRARARRTPPHAATRRT